MKRLYRSEREKIIAGVCGGIGEYFEIDPTIIRILFAIFALVGGGGAVLYLLCWVIIPTKGA